MALYIDNVAKQWHGEQSRFPLLTSPLPYVVELGNVYLTALAVKFAQIVWSLNRR